MAWYKINKAELTKRSKHNWIWNFYTDGEKVYRWFGSASHDCFQVQHAGFGFCSGIEPEEFTLVEEPICNNIVKLYDDDFPSESFGEWTRCEYPSTIAWLNNTDFVRICLLMDSGVVLDAFGRGGELVVKDYVTKKITPISELKSKAVRLAWKESVYPRNYF